MPLLQVRTNAAIDNETEVVAELSRRTAELLGKPESYVMVILDSKLRMAFAGESRACAHLELKSLGLDESRTAAYSEALCGWVEELLDVESARTYIEFSGPQRHLWGWDRRTF